MSRVRRSTLERIAEAIASSGRGPSAAELLERFVAAAAEKLAPESKWLERLERRRLRRLRKDRYLKSQVLSSNVPIQVAQPMTGPVASA